MKLLYYRLMFNLCIILEDIHDRLGGDINRFYPSVKWVSKVIKEMNKE